MAKTPIGVNVYPAPPVGIRMRGAFEVAAALSGFCLRNAHQSLVYCRARSHLVLSAIYLILFAATASAQYHTSGGFTPYVPPPPVYIPPPPPASASTPYHSAYTPSRSNNSSSAPARSTYSSSNSYRSS